MIQNLAPEGIAVATVHKFQGREKETIIYSATDDQLNSEFSDNPNIVNVAVSRAKKQFFLAVSGEEITDGYVKDLLNYIQFNYDVDVTFDNRQTNHYKLIVFNNWPKPSNA